MDSINVKTLTGREASLLALLAQAKGSDMPDDERDRVLAKLSGDALAIGRAIVGLAKRPRADVRRAADGFHEWVDVMRRGR